MFVSGVHSDGRHILPSCHGIEEPVGRFRLPRARDVNQQVQSVTLVPTGDSDSDAERLMRRNVAQVTSLNCAGGLCLPHGVAPWASRAQDGTLQPQRASRRLSRYLDRSRASYARRSTSVATPRPPNWRRAMALSVIEIYLTNPKASQQLPDVGASFQRGMQLKSGCVVAPPYQLRRFNMANPHGSRKK